MSTWNCMIVDDEPLAQKILQQYIGQHPSLKLVAVCDDAFQAQQALANHRIDILFLDINLPKLSGINFLKMVSRPPLTIFTTAYPEFALEGFELDAVDYLLKPFSLERFLKAVTRAISAGPKPSTAAPAAIFLKADKKVFRVVIDDILDLEALGDYVRIRLSGGQHMINTNLREMLEQLPKENFIRVHKSFAIALNKIEYIEGNYVRVGGKDIPIGATYKEELFTLFKKK